MALSGGGGHLGGQRGPGRHMLAACDIPLGRPTVKVESQIGALAGQSASVTQGAMQYPVVGLVVCVHNTLRQVLLALGLHASPARPVRLAAGVTHAKSIRSAR